jgi:cyclophilin family peptidyl-prolyl cis-trans isomerase
MKVTGVMVLVLMMIIILLGSGEYTVRAQDDVSGTPDEICESLLPAQEPETREYDGPEPVLEAGVDYRAIFCTEEGAVYVNLFESHTPVTVNSFVFLAQNGFYNNTSFHRVLEDFMAQGGDPTGTGAGGPGYRFQDEFLSFLRFDRVGLLAMANAGPNTNGSQFFLTTAITSHLDHGHTIFGEVLEGQVVIESLRLRNPQASPDFDGSALYTIVIITDPEAVVSDYEPPEAATQGEMLAAIDAIGQLPGVTLDATATGAYSDADLIDAALDELKPGLETFLTENAYEYGVTMAHVNASCDLDAAPFGQIGYTLHVFATVEDASAAMEDEFLPEFISEGNDFEVTETEHTSTPVYSWQTTVCDRDAIHARMYQRYGRFITVAESIFPVDSPFPADLWLDQVVKFQVYEAIFSDVLRNEVMR